MAGLPACGGTDNDGVDQYGIDRLLFGNSMSALMPAFCRDLARERERSARGCRLRSLVSNRSAVSA